MQLSITGRLAATTACLWLASTNAASAQRHGRVDSLQNYYKGMPDAKIKIRYGNVKIDWKATDLARRTTISIDARESRTGASRSFTGIPLSQLFPTTVTSADVDQYEIHYGFFRKRRIHASDLDATTPILVASKSGNGFHDRLSPIRLVFRSSAGQVIVIDGVVEVRLKIARTDGSRPQSSALR